MDRFLVQFFGLHRINLIEGPGRDPECLSTECICDIAFTIQHLFPLTQHHTGVLVVDVLDDRGNLRMLLTQCLDKIIF